MHLYIFYVKILDPAYQKPFSTKIKSAIMRKRSETIILQRRASLCKCDKKTALRPFRPSGA